MKVISIVIQNDGEGVCIVTPFSSEQTDAILKDIYERIFVGKVNKVGVNPANTTTT